MIANDLTNLTLGANATATVTDSGSELTANDLYDSATLTVQNQGKASIRGALDVGTSAFVPVTGPGNLIVKNSGVVNAVGVSVSLGTATVSTGGRLNAGLVTVGDAIGAATLTISDTGQLNNVQQALIGAQGTLTLLAGASVTVGSRVAVGENATLDVRQGSLAIGPGSLIVPKGQGWVTVAPGGTLSGGNVINNNFVGPGIVDGSVYVYLGGRVSPGDPETLDISGDLQSSGTLDLQIDGTQPGQFDKLVVGGSIEITGGTVEFDFGDGFAPMAGETFDLLSAAGGITLSNADFLVEGLAPGFDYSTSFANGQFDLTALNNGVSTGTSGPPPPSSTPEPATWLLLGSGLLALPLLSRLRRLGIFIER